MFKFSNLKIYRKFLILAVMLGCLSLVSFSSSVAAIPCCDSCDPTWYACQEYCNSEQIKDWMREDCLNDCFNYYNWCTTHCLTCP